MDIAAYFDHPTGRWFFSFGERGLTSVTVRPLTGAQEARQSGAIAIRHADMLAAMLDGSAERYTLPMSVTGSPFQMRVWQEIANVPHGETVTYAELAKRSGNSKAVRAAASACGANPIPIAIPCHRVVRSDGSLGGFAFGLQIKQRMLDFEMDALRKKAA